MTSPTELTPGTTLSQYRLGRLLGEGGMGQVWAATHTLTHRPVALKLIKREHESPEVRHRFLREARAASAVRHPNVVEIYDVLTLEDGTLVMVMEFLVGETLAGLLERRRAIPVRELAAVVLPIVSAVGTAHERGVVHRDLKPDNIFLVRGEGGAISVKVLDFGIAKLSAAESATAQTAGLTNTNAVVGTPHYMSPEQAFGEKDIDHRTDIWSLGVILYECLTGVLPTPGDNFGQIIKILATGGIRPIDEVAKGLPKPVARLVSRMLSRRRQDRPADLREVREVLAHYSDVLTPPFGPPVFKRHGESLRPSARAADPSDLATLKLVDISDLATLKLDAVRTNRVGQRWAIASGIVIALVLAGSIGAALILTRSPEPAAAAAVVGATPSAAPTASPTIPTAASAEVAAPAPIPAAGIPSPSASASSSASVAPPRGRPRPPSPSAVAPAASSPPPGSPRTPGGIVENPPF